jgi:hypothetical protein
MHDTFISYSRTDKPWVEKLATALEAAGYSVWWDVDLLPGQSFEDAIKEHLDNARCVVTVWSEASVDSLWVREESSQALGREVLIPVRYQAVTLPMPFGRIHTADLQGWEGDNNDPRFRQLLQAVARHCSEGESPAELAPTEEGGTLLQRIQAHWKSLVTALALITAIAGGFNDIKQFSIDTWGMLFPQPVVVLTYTAKGDIHAGDTFMLSYQAPENGYLSLWNLDATSGKVEKLLPREGMGTVPMNPRIKSESIYLKAKPGSGTDRFILLWTPGNNPDHLPHRLYDTVAEFSAALKNLEANSPVINKQLEIPLFPAP